MSKLLLFIVILLCFSAQSLAAKPGCKDEALAKAYIIETCVLIRATINGKRGDESYCQKVFRNSHKPGAFSLATDSDCKCQHKECIYDVMDYLKSDHAKKLQYAD